MNHRVSKWIIWLCFLLAQIRQANADGSVYFSNFIGGERQYLYQRDGTRVTTPYVAQLYLQSNGWVAVSKPTPIKSGLILGGEVIIPGHAVWENVDLMVRVWNGSLYSSYDEARRNYAVIGESQTVVTLGGAFPKPPAELIGAFPIRLSCDQLRVAKIVTELATQEGQTIPIQIPTAQSEASCPANMDAVFIRGPVQYYASQVPGNSPGFSLGTLFGVWSQGRERPPFTYVPNANTYGRDLVYFTICDFCDDFTTHDAVAIIIEPSAARQKPTLFLPKPKKPALLVLNSHIYRIDRSTDLKTWEPAGNVTGNYTNVDLSSFVTAAANAHFLRATDITPP